MTQQSMRTISGDLATAPLGESLSHQFMAGEDEDKVKELELSSKIEFTNTNGYPVRNYPNSKFFPAHTYNHYLFRPVLKSPIARLCGKSQMQARVR